MRRSIPLMFAAAAMATVPAGAQESLCNPCVDPPIIRRPVQIEYAGPGERTRVITGAEMRALGVVSVADMVNQLRQAATAEPALQTDAEAEPAATEAKPADTEAESSADEAEPSEQP